MPRSSSRPRLCQPFGASVLAVTAAATFTSTACRSDAPTAAAPATSESARLQVINAARTPVDVLVDGTVRVSALPAASVSPLLAVGEGIRQLVLRPAGGDAGWVAAQVTARASATALVAAQAGATGSLSAAVLSDTAAIPAPGTGKLRVLHLAPNAAAVDIWSFRPGQTTGYRWVFPFRYSGSTNFDQGTPGDREIVITPATLLQFTFASPRDSTLLAEDPHARAIARLVVSVGADQARTVVLLDAAGGGVRLEATGTP